LEKNDGGRWHQRQENLASVPLKATQAAAAHKKLRPLQCIPVKVSILPHTKVKRTTISEYYKQMVSNEPVRWI
jgi:hypothetical protein